VTEIIPARTITGRVVGLYRTEGNGFETSAVETLGLGYDGIAGDRHGGLLRKSGPREPWYPRGTEMRNERQLSILGAEDLADVAAELRIDRLLPEWIGGNLLLEGVPRLSLVPARTLLMFDGGVTIRIDGDNGPCRKSGAAIVRHLPERPDIEFGFVKAAKRRRGLLGWVEKPGTIARGEGVTLRIWEQWIYPFEA